jgi:hypothetical protein
VRSRAHKLENEQSGLNEHGQDGARYYARAVQIKALRAEAARLYQPVKDESRILRIGATI